ncbi:MAG: phosphorylase [Phormidesmis sp.]
MHRKSLDIQIVLAPAGAEYKAVKRALKRVKAAPQLVAIPAGPQGVKQFLEAQKEQLSGKRILLMGLGGSLSPKYAVGDGVAIAHIWNGFGIEEKFECDRTLTTQISQQLGIAIGDGVTCDRVITTAVEKKRLGDRYSADVVDMEGAVLVSELPEAAVAILRVVSDDCGGDLPDISGAIAEDGSLQPIQIALSFIKNPLSAIRFIRGSLEGLKALEDLTFNLFQN